MWQDFKDFITIDNLHIFCFWFLIILTVVGLIEIIYQIRNAVRKINIADEYIKLLEIKTASADTPIKSLSGGNQQKVILARWLLTHPQYLILDEPVDGLDPVMRRQVWSLLLGDVADRGTTVLVSSHNLRELEDVCDHVGILNKGKVLLERSLSDLQDNTVKIQAAYAAAEDPALPPALEALDDDLIARRLSPGGSADLLALALFLRAAAPETWL